MLATFQNERESSSIAARDNIFAEAPTIRLTTLAVHALVKLGNPIPNTLSSDNTWFALLQGHFIVTSRFFVPLSKTINACFNWMGYSGEVGECGHNFHFFMRMTFDIYFMYSLGLQPITWSRSFDGSERNVEG